MATNGSVFYELGPMLAGHAVRWGLYGLGAFLLVMSLMPGVAGAVGAAGFVLVILGAFGHKEMDP